MIKNSKRNWLSSGGFFVCLQLLKFNQYIYSHGSPPPTLSSLPLLLTAIHRIDRLIRINNKWPSLSTRTVSPALTTMPKKSNMLIIFSLSVRKMKRLPERLHWISFAALYNTTAAVQCAKRLRINEADASADDGPLVSSNL